MHARGLASFEPEVPTTPVTITTIPPASGVRLGSAASEALEASEDRVLEHIDWLLAYGHFDEALWRIEIELCLAPTDPMLLRLEAQLNARERALEEDPEIDVEIVYDEDIIDLTTEDETVVEFLPDGLHARIVHEDGDDDVEGDPPLLHYSLGVAYRLMHEHPKAVQELELAATSPSLAASCWSLIGGISLELGRPDVAVEAFLRAFAERRPLLDDEAALAYDVANAYELMQRPAHALHYFQRVAEIDPDYDDVRGAIAVRIALIKSAPMSTEPPAAPADTSALDDLFAAAVLP